MIDSYELHIGNLIKHSDSFAELKAIAEGSPDPYEIFLIRQSAMNKGNFYRKILTEKDVEKVLLLLERGRILKDLAKQFHVGADTLRRSIRDYRIENPLIEK